MEDVQPSIEENLIDLDKRIPTLKNNAKLLTAIKEFTANKNIPLLYILNEHSIIRKTIFEILRKSLNVSVNSYNANRISDINDLIRKNVFVSIKSARDVYEGEITNMKVIKDEESRPLWIDMTLKSAKSTKQLTLSKNLVNIVCNINIGDVVYVEPNIGIVKRLGRSETKVDEFDLEGDRYVQLAKSGVHSKKEREIVLSLYDFDYAFNMYNEDISMYTRKHVDDTVGTYINMGIARILDSYIYIDSGHLLSRGDLAGIVQASKVGNVYSGLKVVICGGSFSSGLYEYIKDYFFVSTANSNENVAELIEYFMKNRMNEELRKVVLKISNFNNAESVMNILNVTTDPNEFSEMYNLQQVE